MLMAQAGAEVTLFERAERVGGRCSAIEANGFRFDTGPTFFLYPRVLEEIFRSVGRDLWRDVPMTRLDPQYRLEFGAGGRIDATPDIGRMRSEIARISPHDAASFERFIIENRAKLKAVSSDSGIAVQQCIGSAAPLGAQSKRRGFVRGGPWPTICRSTSQIRG